MNNEIRKETQRESIINRPHNLAGSVKGITRTRYNITEDKVEYNASKTTPALIKLFMEAIDNPIDVAIKSKKAVKIDIKVTEDFIQIKDNGFGIPSVKKDGHWQAFDAFCEYNTSSNYQENRGKGTKGVNGIGVKLCTTLSKKMIIDSDDGKKKIHIVATENNLKHTITEKKTSGHGVTIKFHPDFNIFDVDSITDTHIQRMYEYTLIQSLTYPEITFRFNNKTIKMTPKKFMELFPASVIDEKEKYFIAIAPNEEDDFKHISYVNGLETYLGGSHIDYVMNQISYSIRDKLHKKKDTKNIKPGDIRSKMLLVMIAKDMKDVDWDGQTKSSITSPTSKMKEYFDTDFDKFTQKILKSPDIMLPITELFTLRAKAKESADLKRLKGKKKKIKSEKYLSATKNKRILFLCEGDSATGGLMPALGRDNFGFYSLKGVPLNAYDSTQAKFTQNKELSELFQIIQNEEYDFVITATDQDLDGIHIKGLLLGFVQKYLPYLLDGRFGELSTPVQIAMKNKKPQRWNYDLGIKFELKKGEVGKYVKGLGSFTPELLKHIVKTDGIEKMISIFNLDDHKILDDWLNGDKADTRKKYIGDNKFDITGL